MIQISPNIYQCIKLERDIIEPEDAAGIHIIEYINTDNGKSYS